MSPENRSNEDGRRCGYAVVDRDGEEQPCDRPATGWRWYQDCDHEDTLDVACELHANEAGRRLAAVERRCIAAESELAAALARIAAVEARAADVDLIRRAIADPFQFLPRNGYFESVAAWSARAVVAALAASPTPTTEQDATK